MGSKRWAKHVHNVRGRDLEAQSGIIMAGYDKDCGSFLSPMMTDVLKARIINQPPNEKESRDDDKIFPGIFANVPASG